MKARGEFKRARRRALARQRLYDAVKTLRAGVAVTMVIRQGPQRYKSFDVAPLANAERTAGARVLFMDGGFVGVGTVSSKDEWTIFSDDGYPAHAASEVVGRITAERVLPPRPPA